MNGGIWKRFLASPGEMAMELGVDLTADGRRGAISLVPYSDSDMRSGALASFRLIDPMQMGLMPHHGSSSADAEVQRLVGPHQANPAGVRVLSYSQTARQKKGQAAKPDP
jgi:hypothetical protein